MSLADAANDHPGGGTVPQPLTLSRVNDGVYRVLDGRGSHVGNLKLINGQWKFKAVGYGPGGEVIPGGGPLTCRHNTLLAVPDEKLVAAALSAPRR